ncbi:hypothetical protein GWK47_012495 [Chionoecetes opilio]|uniref:G-protein coupled receptors family 1 profile domain-containing protein n=1 Tax=Chionoecetes opilio TaxID=41210 RepID=A0A8J4Y1Y6_CHIOP|nr:hypothetical protein GWK47_012495 [Chionoecetes opilio]
MPYWTVDSHWTGNVVVLWCVVGCSKTHPAVKVLLCALFSSTLLMCLLVMPFMAHVGISKIHCNTHIPRALISAMILIYIILMKMEILYITIMAFVRNYHVTLAVWSSTKRQVKMFTAVALTVGIAIYSTAMATLLLGSVWWGMIDNRLGIVLVNVYNYIHFLAPVVLTIACYFSMMFVIKRNKRRLTSTLPNASRGQFMDQATRAMLAVFISNLVFVLPHSIYHVLPLDSDTFTYIIVHTVLYTHLFVDPLVFLFFNLHHRQRFLHALKSYQRWVSFRPPPSSPHTASTLPLHFTSSTSTSTSTDGKIVAKT